MKNLYKAIQSRIVGLNEGVQGHALRRLNNLSGFICGMIRKGSSSLPDIGSGLPQDINAASKTTAAKRFVSHEGTNYQLHFLPYLMAFLTGILAFTCLQAGIYLVIDGSQVGKDNGALMISLVWRGRGIPIVWTTKLGGKGHFKSEDHDSLLRYAIEILAPLLPDNVSVTLLGDGEFDGIELQKICLDAGWDYVLRTARNTLFYEDGDEFQAKNLALEQNQDLLFIPHLEFTKERFKYVNLVYWHDTNKYEDPIILISNLWCPQTIIKHYGFRYSIECLFKDLKSTSFNIHKTRLKDPKEVSNLLIIAALAFLFLTILAIQYDEPKYRKKVQRVRKNVKVLSFFSFAYKLVDYFIQYQINFDFDLQFSFLFQRTNST